MIHRNTFARLGLLGAGPVLSAAIDKLWRNTYKFCVRRHTGRAYTLRVSPRARQNISDVTPRGSESGPHRGGKVPCYSRDPLQGPLR